MRPAKGSGSVHGTFVMRPGQTEEAMGESDGFGLEPACGAEGRG